MTSTPASKSQPLWATPPSQPQRTHPLPPHPSVSPLTYSAVPTSHGRTQPVEMYTTRREANVPSYQRPPNSVHMENLMSSNGPNQEPVTQGGTMSKRQGNADKITNPYGQSSIYPLTSPRTSHPNNSFLQEQMPNSGLASQVQANFAQTSSTYSQPSSVGYNSLIDIYKTEGAYQNQTQIQPATRGQIKQDGSLSFDDSLIHKPDKQYIDKPTSSHPVHLQSRANPCAAETSYLTHQQMPLHLQPQTTQHLQPQSSLQPQSHPLTLTQQPPTIPTQPQSVMQIQQPSTFPNQLQLTHQLQPQMSLQLQPQSLTLTQQPSSIPTHPQSVNLTQQPSAIPTQLQSSLQNQPLSFPSQLPSVLSAQQQILPVQPYLSPQQQSTEPQRYGATSPNQSNGYPTPVHSNPLVTSAYGASMHTPEKMSMNGIAESEMGKVSNPLRNPAYDSFTCSPLQPTSLYTSQPELAVQYSNVNCPTTSGTYIPQPDSYINRDLPEKDTGGLQPSSLKDPDITQKLPDSSGEDTKNLLMLNVDEKARERLTPRIYEERTQEETEARIYSESNIPSVKPDIPLFSNSTHSESEERESHLPEKPIHDNTLLVNGTTYQEADYNKTQPSISTKKENSMHIKHGNDNKPNQSPIADNSHTPEMKTFESDTNKAKCHLLKDDRGSPLTQSKEETTQKMSPDSFSNISKDTNSSSPMKQGSPSRPTSAVSYEASPQEAVESDTDFFDKNIKVTGKVVM